jgi:hypothetical protein
VRTDDPAAGLCLGCGATVPLPPDAVAPGTALAGGTPDPEALKGPRRGAGGGRRSGSSTGSRAPARRATTARGASKPRTGGRARPRESGPDGGEPAK